MSVSEIMVSGMMAELQKLEPVVDLDMRPFESELRDLSDLDLDSEINDGEGPGDEQEEDPNGEDPSCDYFSGYCREEPTMFVDVKVYKSFPADDESAERIIREYYCPRHFLYYVGSLLHITMRIEPTECVLGDHIARYGELSDQQSADPEGADS